MSSPGPTNTKRVTVVEPSHVGTGLSGDCDIDLDQEAHLSVPHSSADSSQVVEQKEADEAAGLPPSGSVLFTTRNVLR